MFNNYSITKLQNLYLYLNKSKLVVMFTIDIIDILGYTAMLVLLISFLMKKVTTLRLINSLGCILFAIWGILIQEWPVVITNVCIVFINTYYLIKKNKL